MLNKVLADEELANGTCYFIPWKPFNDLTYPKTSLKKYGRRLMHLVGKNLDLSWHFAIEGMHSFIQSMHLQSVITLFLQGTELWLKKLRQHSAKKLGRSWYNKKWRDLLLGFMLWLSDEGFEIVNLPICKHFHVELNNCQLHFRAMWATLSRRRKIV